MKTKQLLLFLISTFCLPSNVVAANIGRYLRRLDQSLPEGKKISLACGDQGTGKCGDVPRMAEPTELHEVRCCSDKPIVGWKKWSTCSVWGESDLIGLDGAVGCQAKKTYAEAVDICSRNGARLCTKQEILARCTRVSGCKMDVEMIWTSTIYDESAVKKTSQPVCTGPSGEIWGDPHVVSFDGLKYDCQGLGEYVIVQSKCSGDPLRIHGRFIDPYPDKPGEGTITRALAIKVDEDVPVFYVSVPDNTKESCPMSYALGNEDNIIPSDHIIDLFRAKYDGQVRAYTNGKNIILTFPESGTRVEVSGKRGLWGCVLRINVCLTPKKHGCANCIVGLMGTPNDNKKDDWITLDGDVVPFPESFKGAEGLKASYDYCRANWCVDESQNSLYDIETFNKYNKCSENTFSADKTQAIIDALPAAVASKCNEDKDPDGCRLDTAMELEGTDEDRTEAGLRAAESIAEDGKEMEKIHSITETEAENGAEDFLGPNVANATYDTSEISSGNSKQIPVSAKTWKKEEICPQTPTPAPTPAPTRKREIAPSPTPGVIGDPHFTSWKGEHFEYHGQCDMVLTADPQFADGIGLDVHIRTKLVRYWSYVKNVAIRIGNDILEVEGTADTADRENNYWINYEYQGELEDMAGFPVTVRFNGVHKHFYEIDLSSKYPNQKIVVSAFKEFLRIDFPNRTEEAFGNTKGLLGDFRTGKTLARDGVTNVDEFYRYGSEWQVLPGDAMLFHVLEQPQFPTKCLEPEDPRGERRRRLGESTVTIAEAEAACARLQDAETRKECVYDILATQDVDMVGVY